MKNPHITKELNYGINYLKRHNFLKMYMSLKNEFCPCIRHMWMSTENMSRF